MARLPGHDPRRDRKALAWSVGLFFLLQGIAYAILSRTPHPDRFTENGGAVTETPKLMESIVHWQTHYLLHSSEQNDIAMFGDSSCLMGVQPLILEDYVHERVRNLGSLGILSTDGHADMIEVYLAHHGTPKTVIYHCCPHPLSMPRSQCDEVGYYARMHAHLFRAPMTILPNSPRTWLPSYHLWTRVSTRFRDRNLPHELLAKPRGPYPSDDFVRDSLARRKGYMADPNGPMKAADSPTPAPLELSEDAIPGLVRMFELSSRHGFELIFMMNPLSTNFRMPETERRYADTEARLRQLASPYPRVRFATPLLRYYPAECFATENHLSERYAADNSHEIGRWLAAGREGSLGGKDAPIIQVSRTKSN